MKRTNRSFVLFLWRLPGAHERDRLCETLAFIDADPVAGSGEVILYLRTLLPWMTCEFRACYSTRVPLQGKNALGRSFPSDYQCAFVPFTATRYTEGKNPSGLPSSELRDVAALDSVTLAPRGTMEATTEQ